MGYNHPYRENRRLGELCNELSRLRRDLFFHRRVENKASALDEGRRGRSF